jgi:hypothetical protein
VDLLIITADDFDTHAQVWQVQIDGLADHFLLWIGNRLEVHVLPLRAVRRAVRAGEPLVKSLKADALTLVGRDLSDLLTEPSPRKRSSRKASTQ